MWEYFMGVQWTGWRPPPPPRPEYNPEEEAPKWDIMRLRYIDPVDKGPIPWAPVGSKPEHPDQPDWRGVIRKNVKEYPIPEPYTFGMPNDPKYFWFDTPDYADPFKKLWYATKWFLASGTLAALACGACEEKPMTVANNIRLAKIIVIPWLTAGLACSATVVVLANLRGKKDDLYNYAAGGTVAASILGRKHYISWVRWMAVLPILACATKHTAEQNGQMIPRLNQRLYRGTVSGSDASHGIGSGEFLPSWFPKLSYGDPGRDTRRNF